MKTCSYCGRENEDVAPCCAECGTAEFKGKSSVQPVAPVEQDKPVPFVPRILSPAERQLSFVTLQSCRTLEEADLLVTQLNSAGIKATIPDEALMQTVAWNANTYGYVRVQVTPAQYDEAAQFLKEWETGRDPDTDEEAASKRERAEKTLPLAVACFLLLLSASCFPGLLFAGMIRSSYLKRGFQRRADAVWMYFAIGFCFWLMVLMIISIKGGR